VFGAVIGGTYNWRYIQLAVHIITTKLWRVN